MRIDYVSTTRKFAVHAEWSDRPLPSWLGAGPWIADTYDAASRFVEAVEAKVQREMWA